MKIFGAFVLLSLPLVGQAFTDISTDHEHQMAIAYMEESGLVEGYADGTFRPENTINRAEFTKLIVGAQFSEFQVDRCQPSGNGFTDVGPNDWFAGYVCLAQEKEMVSGYPDGSFAPGNEINFSEAAKIIVQAFGFETEDVRPWYAPFAQVLSDKKAIPTSIDSPNKLITRGEMAEIMWRLKTKNEAQSGTRFTFTSRAKVLSDRNNAESDDSTSVAGSSSVLELVNQARAARGLKTLTIDPTLQKVAQEYAEAMNAGDFFDHLDPTGDGPAERVSAAGYQWRSVAENIAKGQTSEAQVFEVWKDSPGHWRNIISSAYEDTGIGQVKISDNEFFKGSYWVQVFGTKLD